jgi:hypothetical protein
MKNIKKTTRLSSFNVTKRANFIDRIMTKSFDIALVCSEPAKWVYI